MWNVKHLRLQVYDVNLVIVLSIFPSSNVRFPHTNQLVLPFLWILRSLLSTDNSFAQLLFWLYSLTLLKHFQSLFYVVRQWFAFLISQTGKMLPCFTCSTTLVMHWRLSVFPMIRDTLREQRLSLHFLSRSLESMPLVLSSHVREYGENLNCIMRFEHEYYAS